ncbi:MAG: hypothetical protein AAFN74_25535 [Myxococcota bacterium]
MLYSRRNILSAAAAAAGSTLLPVRARAQSRAEPRFLIVLTAHGGASIVDSLLAVSRSQCAAAGGDPSRLTTFADYPSSPPTGNAYQYVRPVPASPFSAPSWRGTLNFGRPINRAIDLFDVINKHKQDMLVMTQTVTSVNHDVGQARSVSGNGAWRGRTIQEETAAAYGAEMPLPNVHLTSGSGFVRRGIDEDIASRFLGETVADPLVWPLALNSSAAIRPWLSSDAIASMRTLRDSLENQTSFARIFERSRRRASFMSRRNTRQQELEAADLTPKLLLQQSSATFRLEDFGLTAAPESDRLRQILPSLDEDPVEAQVALAYLLLKNRISCAVTLGPNAAGVTVGNPNDPDFLRQPALGFDYSHTDHWPAQMWMWERVLNLADTLIELLKNEPYDDNTSLWDRTLIWVTTEFGRSKVRPPNADTFSSGHNLNNGTLFISPMLRGNQVVGGVDAATLETFGTAEGSWNTPQPERHLSEREPYALALAALGIDASQSGLPDVSSLVRRQ